MAIGIAAVLTRHVALLVYIRCNLGTVICFVLFLGFPPSGFTTFGGALCPTLVLHIVHLLIQFETSIPSLNTLRTLLPLFHGRSLGGVQTS